MDTPPAAEQEETRVLQLITPAQQQFIEALLLGSNVSQAASLAGISRRTAYYWMNDPSNPIRKEYEKQRYLLHQEIAVRVTSIRTKALQALEDLLSPESPPFMRLGAVKMVYDSCLHDMILPQEAPSAIDLVHDSADAYHKESWDQQVNQAALYDDRGRERIVDED
ncbi:MAG TPA: hypothetical protein VFA10_08955 [Ktedonobacteraceae bacterium]|nr:hypothetical protein [Ktedonobacteraceae bacterium]